MKCLICERFALELICKDCQIDYLTPQIKERELITNFFVYSFFDYENVKELLYSKYQHIGSCVYKILARNSLAQFATQFVQNLSAAETIYATGIDDNPKKGFSHSAILASSLQATHNEAKIKPLFNILRANSPIKYANQSYEYRLTHPRDFVLQKTIKGSVILVDDIVTSGLTLLEAKDTLTRHDTQTLFALCLCDLHLEKGQK